MANTYDPNDGGYNTQSYFDPQDRDSWYFGALNREEANKTLNKMADNGVFMVRDSTTIRGDFVLCVKEENKNSHYIINKIMVNGMPKFRIGDQEFQDLPSLLAFYKTHFLDTTHLVKPVSMDARDKYTALYDFEGRDPEDLPFKKGEVLIILHRDEEQWWTARNYLGRSGQVPVPYLKKIEDSTEDAPAVTQQSNDAHRSMHLHDSQRHLHQQQEPVVPRTQRPLPAKAEVIRARTPSAFDQTALRLKVGDIVTVTEMNINGQWEGECNGVTGLFPFTHVKFLDDIEEENQ